MKNLRNTKGITLIALVITIVVLLILAGVSISMLTGDNGILTKASSAKEKSAQAEAEELVKLAILASYGQDGEIDLGELENNLKDISGISGLPTESITAGSFPLTLTVKGQEVKITKTENGLEAEATGLVQTPTEVEITGIEATDITVEVGETEKIGITKTPENSTEGVSYTSNNTEIATVDASGNVTGIAEGETTITIKSESEKITTSCIVTVTPRTISYSWEQLGNIAKAISDNDDTITNESLEAKVTIDEVEYTLRVGDTTTVSYDGEDKTVRIMGFNHDELTSNTAYGEGEDNTYAGISFEFVNIITNGSMNSSDTNSEGWGACAIRSTLNDETSGEITKLSNKSLIKQVTKDYIKTYSSASSVTTCADKLWLLSCSEIWDNPRGTSAAYGCAIAKEGNQYKYYKDIDADAGTATPALVKDSNFWWLRSPNYRNSVYFGGDNFCIVLSTGDCGNIGASSSRGLAPGFSI